MTRLHVIGGGLAGLAAACQAARQGIPATVHEAAPQAGGRCRTVTERGGFTHDNGTHVLLGANRRALAFLDLIGAREGWIEPEPDGLPVYDLRNGRLAQVGLSPWSWLSAERRPEGLTLGDLPRLIRLSLPLPDRPVEAVIGRRPILDSLVEPLTVAVLNTPVGIASARRLGIALRRIARPGASRLFVAREGLGPNLVEPALRFLAEHGGAIRTGARLRQLVLAAGRATALAFADGEVPLEPDDRIVIALPPGETGRLVPGLAPPDAYEPIVNVHYRLDGPERPRFLGFRGALSQWALARRDHVSVTVSAAGEAVDMEASALAAKVWSEIEPGFAALGTFAPGRPTPEARVIKEKRATIRQEVGMPAAPPIRPLPNLALAGDWLSELPATIESAVESGERAVAALYPSGRGAMKQAPS